MLFVKDFNINFNIDNDRVKFREEKLQEKAEILKEKCQEKDLEFEESEKRKEILRQMVCHL